MIHKTQNIKNCNSSCFYIAFLHPLTVLLFKEKYYLYLRMTRKKKNKYTNRFDKQEKEQNHTHHR